MIGLFQIIEIDSQNVRTSDRGFREIENRLPRTLGDSADFEGLFSIIIEIENQKSGEIGRKSSPGKGFSWNRN